MFTWFSKDGAELGLNISEMGLLLFAALVAIGLIGEYRKDKDERWKDWTSRFELLVIVGVVGEVVFDGLIFGFSGKLSVLQDVAVAAADERAGAAHERAGVAIGNAAETNKAVALLTKENLALQAKLRGVDTKLVDREMNDGERAEIARRLKDDRYLVTIVRIDEREARQYANNIADALPKPNVTVRFEDIKTSPLTGVIVCENTQRDINLFHALRAGSVEPKFSRRRAKDRPVGCDKDLSAPATAATAQPPFGYFPDQSQIQPRGTVILVGQKKR